MRNKRSGYKVVKSLVAIFAIIFAVFVWSTLSITFYMTLNDPSGIVPLGFTVFGIVSFSGVALFGLVYAVMSYHES